MLDRLREPAERDVLDEATRWLRAALLDGPVADNPSITTRLPFPYHWIPGPVRIRLRDWLVGRSIARLASAPRFPDLYAENGADVVNSRLGDGDRPRWAWPAGKRCALVVTQDVDTGGEHREVRALAETASTLGLRSTFMFVGQYMERYADLARDLRRDGFEIGLHDVVHDNRIAFQPAAAIRARLAPWLERWRDELGVRGFRSPSWYASPTLWDALADLGMTYDCSVQDTNALQEAHRTVGAATYYPYMRGPLVIVPATVPFDELPWSLGVSRAETPAFWRDKIDHVAANGGALVVNAHPSPWFCGTEEGRQALEACLREIVDRHQPWCATAGQLADHVRAEAARGAMRELPGDPVVRIPRLGPGLEPGGPRSNPVRSGGQPSMARARVSAIVRSWLSVSSGNIGSDSTSEARRSVTGKSPGAPPRYA